MKIGKMKRHFIIIKPFAIARQCIAFPVYYRINCSLCACNNHDLLPRVILVTF